MSRKGSRGLILFICFMLVFGLCVQQRAMAASGAPDPLDSAIPNEPITGAAYGNGVYAAVGYYGKILTSANGVDWQIAADKTRLDVTYTGVAYGNSQFVAVGYDGTIMTSPNGTVWTQRDSTVTGIISRVAYVTTNGINQFFAVTKGGVLLTSTDGIAWSSASVGTSNDLTSIAFSSSAVVIGDSGGYMHTSGDGANWGHKKLDASSFFINSVFNLNGRFYANDPIVGTYMSADGANWGKLWSVSSPSQVFGGLYDGTNYYLFGYDGTSYGGIFKSGNGGDNFTPQSKSTTMTSQNAFYANGVYMQLGNDGIVVSTNGTNWDYAYGGVVSSVFYDGTKYIAVGKRGSDGFIKYSTDYVNWTYAALPQRVPALTSITSGMGKYIAVSDNPGTVLVSGDGMSWTVNSPTISRYGFTSIAFANANFVAVNKVGSIYLSTDKGANWTQVRSDSNYNALRFITGQGGFSVAGDSGLFLQSPDSGNTWSTVSSIPAAFTFDKKSIHSTDIPFSFSFGTLNKITASNYGSDIVEGTDYSVSGTTVTLKKSFLAKLPLGWQTIALHLSTGGSFTRMAVNVVNTSPALAQVSSVQLTPSGNASWSSVSGAAGYEVQLYRNGAVWGGAVWVSAGSGSYNVLAAMRAAGPGVYTFKVKALGDTVTYQDGPQSNASSGVTIYKTPTEDGTPKNGTTQRLDFSIVVNAQNGTQATAKIGGQNVLQTGTEVAVANGKATLPIDMDGLSEGMNQIAIALKDAQGNFSEPLTVAVTKDTTPPTAATEDGTADKAGTTQTANFNLIVNAETGAAVTAKVSGTNVLQAGVSVTAAGGLATLPIDLSKLSEGVNVITIVVTDAVENVSSPLTVSVTKDTVSAAKAALEIGYGGSDTAASVTQALTLPATGLNGTTVTWTTSASATIAGTGAVTRPAYGEGDATVTVTATVTKDGVSQTKTFTLIVLQQEPTDTQAVSEAKAALDITYGGSDTAGSVTQALTLPGAGLHGTTVTWSSNGQAAISNTGVVTRPAFGDGDATVILTATITKGAVSETKTFTLTVVKLAQTDAEAVSAAKTALEIGYGGSDTVASVTQALTLPAGEFGTTVTWSSDTEATISDAGVVTRPSFGSGDATVTLTATITKGAVSETKTFTLIVVKLAQTDAEAVSEAKAALEIGFGGSDTAVSVTQALTLPVGQFGTTVTWSSDTEATISDAGVVTRPSFGSGDATVTLTATISKGAVNETKAFTLTVVKLAQTDAEAVSAAKAALEIGFGGSDAAASVTQALTLPAGQFGTTVAWSSDTEATISDAGVVTRPSFGSGDATVTLTATITKGAVSETKAFTLTVVKLAQTDAEAVSAATAALEIGYGGSDTAASVTQALTLPAGQFGTTVTWSSDTEATISDAGVVTRPLFGSGDATVTLTATIAKGAVSETKAFTLTVVKLAQTDAEAVSAAKAILEIGYSGSDTASSVTQALTLPAGQFGTTVTWSSDTEATISDAGVVTRPSYTNGDAMVTLTATITKGGASETKSFALTVVKLAQTDAEAVSAAKAALEIGFGGSDTAASVTQALTMPAGQFGTTVTWSSDTEATISDAGVVTRPSYTDGDATVTLTAIITKGAVSETKTFTLTVVKLAQTDAEAVSAAKSTLAITYGGSDSAASVTQAITLPTTGLNGTTISWSSDAQAMISNTGEVARPSFGDGDATITLTATITKGAVSETKKFTLIVLEREQTDAEAVSAANAVLAITYGGSDSATSVTQAVTLPTIGLNGTTISWSSDTPATITTLGAVTRPTYGTGNATVTLTATITKGTVSETKTFTLTVLELEQTDAEAVSAAKSTLAITYGGTDTAVSVTQAVTLPTTGQNGTTVTWSSDTPATITTSGAVTRPVYGAGNATVTLTATITKGTVSETKTFTLTVLELEQTDAEAVSAAKSTLAITYGGTDTASNVTQAVTLPTTGQNGTTVTWSSDAPSTISTTGAVTRPAYGAGNATVTLTATITKGTVSETKTFTLTVLELEQTDAEAVSAAKSTLAITYGGTDSATSVTQALTLPTTGLNGTTISWSSDTPTTITTSGAVTRPVYGAGNATVTLTATITKGTVSETKTFTLTVLELEQTDAEAVSAAKSTLAITYGGTDSATSVTQALTLPTTGLNGTTISWSSDTPTTITTSGAVTRPVYGAGNATVTLTATITKGTASETKTFTITVLELEQTDAEAVNAAKSTLAITYGGTDTASNVTQAVTLPTTGQNGTTVTWSSDTPATITTSGAVTRPVYGAGNATVTLTATITKGTASETKTFTLTVPELVQTDAEAVSTAKSTLVITYGGSDSATSVTQALTLPTTGLNGTTISWSSDAPSTISTTGAVTRPAYGAGNATVTLTATITKGTASETKTFTLTVPELVQTDAEAVSAAKSTLAITYGGTDSATSVTQAVTLPTIGLNGTTISWSSDTPATITTLGAVTRPTYGTGNATVTLTATITKGTASETKTFTLTVLELEQTDAEAVNAAKSTLAITYGGTDTASNVTQAVTLPTTGQNGTTVTWSSDAPSTISTTGAVTRPAYGAGNATVTLTATITKGTASETKTFTLTVPELVQTDAEAVSAAKSTLVITYGGSDSATSVTQALMLPTTGLNGTTISWSSDAPSTISTTGAVTRPAYGAGNATVTLTATITKGTASETKTFTLTVPELVQTDAEAVSAAKSTLAITYGGTDSATSVTQAVTLPTTGQDGTTVKWSSDAATTISTNGTVTRPAYEAGDATVTLTATITKGTASETKTFILTVLKLAEVTPPVDVTPPAAPTVNAVDSDDLVITGTAEAGSTVTVKAGGTTLGTAKATGGAFSITLTAALSAGTELEVTATDAASNVSPATHVTVTEANTTPVDVTPPAAPAVNAVDSDDLVITGTAEAGSTVTVKAGSTTLGTAKATGGAFSITLTAALSAGTELEVTATDAASNVSPATHVTVTEANTTPVDVTPPAAPAVNAVDSDDLVITGTAEAGSTVTVKAGSTTLGTAKATGGAFSITLTAALSAGTELEVTATDAASNVSPATHVTVTEVNTTPVDVTPPAAPTVNAVDSDDLVITGTAEAGSTVTVKTGGTTLGTATVTGGTFSITLTAARSASTELEITATDAAGNVSPATHITVTAVTPAPTPTPTPTPTPEPSDTPVTSTDGALTLPVGRAGQVSLGDHVMISIPAGSTDTELKLTIEEVLNTQELLSDKDVLASPIFELLKNFSENFNKPVTLTFAFDSSKLSAGKRAAVFYYDEAKKEWVEVGGSVNGGSITADVNHFTKFAVMVVDQLSDITGHWAEASIKQAVSNGIVKGYQDGTFKPGKTVTRAEFAVMLMNALKPEGNGAALTFTDKAEIGAWAQKAVAQAVQAGIITGYADGSFGPNEEITRAEMAAMIAKAMGKSTEGAGATGFADDKDIPAWAKAGVAFVKQAGVMQGKGDNRFIPEDHATRAEAVTVLMNLLEQ
ncbi:immunoglobulin-like domain-containing protein [Paenibacillus silvisoli]|uniref:immunoglobulin-like domain-containing protein n=1 Tax=Paenibacillus silvisoli TaxID=3110539 RepID=UPI00280453B4|nr:immunoglobulin-like domain-containing protein [Paenibacillus silvisoli]